MPVASLDELHWINRFARLPERFYTRLSPRPVQQPQLVHGNPQVAEWLGLTPQALQSPDTLQALAGNRAIAGAEPLASVYSGHQFGVWAGQLGDGRAHLLGEVEGPAGCFELQLKGSGLTPYSRMGDGRAVLRSSVREYLASAAMHGLGIPTTHALALIRAHDPVQRETLERAAVVARVASSFVRFGHFQHWAAAGDHGALQILTDYVVDAWYPECRRGDDGQPVSGDIVVVNLLNAVLQRTATLMAQWQSVGFMHGVMNTDNLSIVGLTLDYGPYGFMDGFDANHICNHTDTAGRYAWNVQPAVAHWNLYRLAEALRPLVSDAAPLRAALDNFEPAFTQAFTSLMAAKLGLRHWQDDDQPLLDELWQLLHTQRADFTQAFRRLAWADLPPDAAEAEQVALDALGQRGHFLDLFYDTVSAEHWLQRWQARANHGWANPHERRQAMLSVNPLYVLRNHLAENAIRAADQGDDTEVVRLFEVLQQPYQCQPGAQAYAELPPDWARGLEVSCSS